VDRRGTTFFLIAVFIIVPPLPPKTSPPPLVSLVALTVFRSDVSFVPVSGPTLWLCVQLLYEMPSFPPCTPSSLPPLPPFDRFLAFPSRLLYFSSPLCLLGAPGGRGDPGIDFTPSSVQVLGLLPL